MRKKHGQKCKYLLQDVEKIENHMEAMDRVTEDSTSVAIVAVTTIQRNCGNLNLIFDLTKKAKRTRKSKPKGAGNKKYLMLQI